MYKNSILTATVPQRLCKNTNKKVTTWQSCRIIATVAASKSTIDMLYMIGRAVCCRMQVRFFTSNMVK